MVQTAAVIGGGVIGAGWAARLIENGIDVIVHDPAPDAETKMAVVLANAERAYAKLTMAPRRSKGTVSFAPSVGEAARDAELIVEAVPERIDIKLKVLAEIETTARPDALIASSTSGFLPSDLQAGLKHPERLLVAHPFNPVYLLPVVEIVAGKQTAAAAVEQAMAFYPTLGMKPIHVRKEIDAFVADRLLETLWREALWLIKDGICTTQELDDIMRYGFGLRWAQMGLFETYRTAGGDAGMRHFMAQFGPCLTWPWSRLTNVPEFNDELVDLIAGQSDAQSGHMTINELIQKRDDNLIAIQQALKGNDWGAGQLLAAYEKQLYAQAADSPKADDLSGPLLTLERILPAHYADYNGHMTESRYLECFADATDTLMRMLGVDAAYLENGGSYFTVETHIRHLAEVKTGERITVTTQLIDGAGKKLHVFHRMNHADGTLLATGEHMLIHVSLQTRAASNPAEPVKSRLAELAAAHANLSAPDGLGRAIGMKR